MRTFNRKTFYLICVCTFLVAVWTTDALASDVDNDGIGDSYDNCPETPNPGQQDVDNDGTGDACDEDTIYGYISGESKEGVDVNISTAGRSGEDLLATLITNENGYYSIGDLENNLYRVTPEKYDYIFSPSSAYVTISTVLYPGGHDYCLDYGPCEEGEGNCDGDSQCESGLICAQDVGANYGWPSGVDVCEKSDYPGGHDYCLDYGPCEEGEGDCDGDSQCESGLICAQDVGANYGWPSGVDVCEKSDYPGGHDYCRDYGPCEEGEGDCDGASQCASGLMCAQNVGANYGWPSGVDVCVSVKRKVGRFRK